MSSSVGKRGRRYWVVSPNLKPSEKTVPAWGRASVVGRAAFMGWGQDHRIGYRFVHEIRPGDLALVGRRHNGRPQIFGFGVVRGAYKTRVERAEIPEGEAFESARDLRPFVNLTAETLPRRIPFIEALRHSSALAQLHPYLNRDHHRVCRWLENRLSSKDKRRSAKNTSGTDDIIRQSAFETQISAPPRNFQRHFKVHIRDRVTTATRSEAGLLARYRQWLKWQGRDLPTFRSNRLQCDGFEKVRRNLIEAKGATRREYLRMAVGELLDYAYQAKKKFGRLNKAILVPKKPKDDLVEWLRSLNISLIWPEKGAFRDNAKEQFT